MKLRIIDQICVSSVQSETLRPGQEIEVSDALGKELLERHPDKLEVIAEPAAKAEPAHPNKAAPAHPNKAAKVPPQKGAKKPKG